MEENYYIIIYGVTVMRKEIQNSQKYENSLLINFQRIIFIYILECRGGELLPRRRPHELLTHYQSAGFLHHEYYFSLCSATFPIFP